MQQLLPTIPPAVRERLDKAGAKPFSHKPIRNDRNPRHFDYWAMNAFILAGCWIGRRWSTKTGAPRLLWGAAMTGVPMFAIADLSRLEHQSDYLGHRKTLEERLDFHPVTRRAWNRALEANNEYQDQLRKDISALEKKVAQRAAA